MQQLYKVFSKVINKEIIIELIINGRNSRSHYYRVALLIKVNKI